MSFNFSLDQPPEENALNQMMIALRPLWNAWKWWQESEREWVFQPQYAGMGYVSLYATPPETETRVAEEVVSRLQSTCPQNCRFKDVIIQSPTKTE